MVLAGWTIFFTAGGAVALIHSLTSDVIGEDGKLGGIIVGATFLVMGVPALLFALPLAIKNARDTSRGSGARGPVTYADDAGEPGWASTMRMGSQAMRDFSAGSAAAGGTADGDSSAQLERLQRLREQGALTQAEFEAQKRRIPGR